MSQQQFKIITVHDLYKRIVTLLFTSSTLIWAIADELKHNKPDYEYLLFNQMLTTRHALLQYWFWVYMLSFTFKTTFNIK